ncbi:hypothetical protein J2W34_001833 [Variovorax boronicumulans]|uniref:hypothetical protein n=1 Tax=Variovorax boronicumulans TaxID=436515 RepID=UPI0027881B71|nr:hypothetical protein [Variovorax boronicumulans]MDQ0070059.1 hypothetical protein [Variovorax boronicumulans]
MDHQLENLGPDRFQLICQALLVKEFPDVICYPVGMPDGGRDAVQNSVPNNKGTIVFQVKFSKSPDTVDRKWVLETARGEGEKVKRLRDKGASKTFLSPMSLGHRILKRELWIS